MGKPVRTGMLALVTLLAPISLSALNIEAGVSADFYPAGASQVIGAEQPIASFWLGVPLAYGLTLVGAYCHQGGERVFYYREGPGVSGQEFEWSDSFYSGTLMTNSQERQKYPYEFGASESRLLDIRLKWDSGRRPISFFMDFGPSAVLVLPPRMTVFDPSNTPGISSVSEAEFALNSIRNSMNQSGTAIAGIGQFRFGANMGAGIRLRLGPISVLAELRYRWADCMPSVIDIGNLSGGLAFVVN